MTPLFAHTGDARAIATDLIALAKEQAVPVTIMLLVSAAGGASPAADGESTANQAGQPADAVAALSDPFFRVVQALGRETIPTRKLARLAGYKPGKHFSKILTEMRRQRIIDRAMGGWQVLAPYCGQGIPVDVSTRTR